MENNINYNRNNNLEKVSIGWFFLAFFFPVVGLILFFIYKKSILLMGKRLLVGSICGFLTSFVSFSVSIIFLLSFFSNNVYSLTLENSSESYTYNETYNILLLNKNDDNGMFVLENNVVRNYFDGIIVEGDVRVEETTRKIGTWTIDDEGYYLLLTEKTFLKIDFSGSGKNNYIDKMKFSYRSQYGIDIGNKILDEKWVEIEPIKGMKTKILLNEDDMSIMKFSTTIKYSSLIKYNL